MLSVSICAYLLGFILTTALTDWPRVSLNNKTFYPILIANVFWPFLWVWLAWMVLTDA
jgi:hypothetical protein